MRKSMSEEKKIHENYYLNKKTTQVLRYEWFAKKYFKNVKGKKILEIGCGDGGILQFLKDNNEVHAVDISKNAVKFLREYGINAKISDISEERLPFKDKNFDYVIILETLEHLKSPQFAIEEIQRVLKKGGIMIASTPNPRTGHKFIYPCLFRLNNLKEYLMNNGFVIKETSKYGICPPLWKNIKNKVDRQWIIQKKKSVKNGDGITMFSRVARHLSSDIANKLKHHKFAWSFVFVCINANPNGAKKLYFDIAQETKGAY
jgi:ubiquinone/menaquinone biosynthesis C-methylase UbiE